MTKYKGNSGNLMQHWTLCELLHIVQSQGVPGLNFIDAHSMAPIADPPEQNDPTFTQARNGLANDASVYGAAWYQLAPNVGYPNSANFVHQVWARDFHMLLCENHQGTIVTLNDWRDHVNTKHGRDLVEVHPGNWRDRFDCGLPSPVAVGLPPGSLTLVSFDPYMYNRHRDVVDRNEGNLYPEYVQQALRELRKVEGAVLLQLSTYSILGGNVQDDVLASLDGILGDGGLGFTRRARIKVDHTMMSLIYTRDVSSAIRNGIRGLPCRFQEWINAL